MVAIQIVTCSDSQTSETAAKLYEGEMEVCDGGQNCMGAT